MLTANLLKFISARVNYLKSSSTLNVTNRNFTSVKIRKKEKSPTSSSSSSPSFQGDEATNTTTITTKLPEYARKVFKTKEELNVLREFPIKWLKKKPAPKSFYIAHSNTAKLIGNHLKTNLQNDTLLEVNPGNGILTKEILKSDEFSKLILIESFDEFVGNLKKLQELHPERIRLKHGDFVHIWKLVYRDKIDNGQRLHELLNDVPKKEFTDDSNMRVFAAVGSLHFFKHLINSLVFDGSLYSYGRCEMYLITPPPIFIHLTCDKEVGYLTFRATSILFQIMFEYQLIEKFPRSHFLPWSFEYNMKKRKRLAKVESIDQEYFYLIRLIPRRNLFELCPPDKMKALWYFVKQNCVSRKNRIIPNLEKYVPNSGIRLILNPNKDKTIIERLFPDDDLSILPKYSKPCTTMTNQDHYPSMNIFTEFGDLTPSQMLTLFCTFYKWPEYEQSSFLASLDNHLLRIETSGVDNMEATVLHEDDSDNDDDYDDHEISK